MKRFIYELRLQVHMYAFMYVNPETIPVEDYFTATTTFAYNYKKISTTGPVPKHWLRFSYTCLEHFELVVNCDETELKTIRPHIQQ